MIISDSKRTDIPSHYAEWLYNRIQEGYVLARNPMNAHQIISINLVPEMIDGIVFWTKNPAPMLSRIDELNKYTYYFHFTLNPYGEDIEQALPSKINGYTQKCIISFVDMYKNTANNVKGLELETDKNKDMHSLQRNFSRQESIMA